MLLVRGVTARSPFFAPSFFVVPSIEMHLEVRLQMMIVQMGLLKGDARATGPERGQHMHRRVVQRGLAVLSEHLLGLVLELVQFVESVWVLQGRRVHSCRQCLRRLGCLVHLCVHGGVGSRLFSNHAVAKFSFGTLLHFEVRVRLDRWPDQSDST